MGEVGICQFLIKKEKCKIRGCTLARWNSI
jgi:hypothetical protein